VVLVFTPLAVALVVVGAAAWVLVDARRWARAGTPVVFRIGSLTIERPETWAALCLLLLVFALPIYAIARRN
jgi:hypothetical protein